MIAKLLIEKKREGHALGTAEIRSFIEGFCSGEIPDYQMAAMAMAICCRGMTARETADLVDVMTKSGRTLTWEMPTADKHSTGGVGDKLSFVIQPLVAACGVSVPSLVGRGLGLTGGTADKLETIPGLSCALSLEDFTRVVTETGLALALQTDEIAPADRKLYALRDVTGTVASIPLITASILSKKLAEGAGTLVFDVKCGRGAFMKTPEDAHALAASLVEGAKAAGRHAASLVTQMDSPLGYAVGNANELIEALAWLGEPRFAASPRLRGLPCCDDIVDLCVKFAANMVSLARKMPLEASEALCRAKLADGSALARFAAMIAAQGGSLDRFAAFCERPTFKFRIQTMRSGYVQDIDAEKVARVALQLGAGREKAGDVIDPLAGVTLAVRRGTRVAVGQPLATLERSTDPEGLERAAADLYKAFLIGSEPPEQRPLLFS